MKCFLCDKPITVLKPLPVPSKSGGYVLVGDRGVCFFCHKYIHAGVATPIYRKDGKWLHTDVDRNYAPREGEIDLAWTAFEKYIADLVVE